MSDGSDQAADRLRRAKEAILHEWEREVRTRIPPARPQDPLALRNSLPEVLDWMVQSLASSRIPRSVLEEQRLATGHGMHRAKNADYSLEQVIDEYHALRSVLFEVLEREGPLERRDENLILDVLFMSIKGAAAEFTDVRNRQRAELTEQLDRANEGLRDALGQKSTEAQIRAHLLETIFDRVEDYAIFTLDPDGRVTSWARGAQKMKGYTAGEIAGKHYSVLYPDDGRARGEPEAHLRMAASEGRFRGEGLRRRKNGEHFLADVFITPMWHEGVLVGFFKIVSDLTERNRIIQERDLSRTRVESLEVESELRDRFIFTLSHDLRTPLSSAKVAAQMIMRDAGNAAGHADLAQRAIRSITRVDNMISDLLDASRIKAGEPMSLNPQECDLTAKVRSVTEELTALHGERFQIVAPPQLVGFWDPHKMRRVLENLMTNGIKYGAPNGVVTVRLEELRDRVMVTVHNEGNPISLQDQEALFELFRRTRSASSGPKEGWGLGLTLVRGITEAHGGVVTVRSTPGDGTSFLLDFPRDARPRAAPSP